MDMLPGKTVERLSQYRRRLLGYLDSGKEFIFSHELAAILNITAVQVRRDLMLLGYSSVYRKGYPVRKLIDVIGQRLDSIKGQNVAIIGLGHLGTALTTYLTGLRPKLYIVAGFDNDPEKVGRKVSGVKCYSVKNMKDTIKRKEISIGVLAVPQESAQEVCNELVESGIRGILNFTHVPLVVPPHVYLEEYDMITSLEKVAYFVKKWSK
jgi:redox-sensing transcriptional repressor